MRSNIRFSVVLLLLCFTCTNPQCGPLVNKNKHNFFSTELKSLNKHPPSVNSLKQQLKQVLKLPIGAVPLP